MREFNDEAPPPLAPTLGRRSAETDAYGPLMRRLEELWHGPVPPSRKAQQRVFRFADRKAELQHLSDRGAVKKKRSGEDRFRPVLPDTPPPTPIRGDFWPPPSVEPSDEGFIKPEVSDTKRPLRDGFSRALTKIIDSKKNKIEVIPKTEKADINETNLSEQLSKLFPKLDEVINEKKDDEKNEAKIENLTQILSKTDSNSVPFEFEFFTGGKNEKFDEISRSLQLSSDNLEFLDFLQSDICKRILVSNKLKIHVETGNIYYGNQDTNESIFDFFSKTTGSK